MSASIKKLLFVLKLIAFTAVSNIINNVVFVKTQNLHDFFLCRNCGEQIAQLSDIVNIPSKLALRQRNDTFGTKQHVLIQLFQNPQGINFEVVTSTKASVLRASKETDGDTWWPGFNWIILGCPRCRQHIGWEYVLHDNLNTEQTSFFGLVLGNLLHQNDEDNLIVLPKTYTS